MQDRVHIELRDLSRSYATRGRSRAVLDDVSASIRHGEFLVLVGRSGSGKSTLLNLIGGLDRPTSGDVLIDGQSLSALNEDGLSRLRRHKVGYVFQFFNLIPTLSALENVALPIQFARRRKFKPEERARELLSHLGLGDRQLVVTGDAGARSGCDDERRHGRPRCQSPRPGRRCR